MRSDAIWGQLYEIALSRNIRWPDGLSAKKMAFVERWSLVEIWLYYNLWFHKIELYILCIFYFKNVLILLAKVFYVPNSFSKSPFSNLRILVIIKWLPDIKYCSPKKDLVQYCMRGLKNQNGCQTITSQCLELRATCQVLTHDWFLVLIRSVQYPRIRLCSKKNRRSPSCSQPVKFRVPNIWFIWKISD